MVKYFCDRCGKERGQYELFTVTITPPKIWSYSDPMAEYYEGGLHLCSNCMEKINECIDELGRRK